MKRRALLKGAIIGPLVLGVPLLYQSPLFQNSVPDLRHLKDKEAKVFEALLNAWTEDWPSSNLDSSQRLKALDAVLEVVRPDKRAELLLAIKLLAFAPSCFFLTGSINPWASSSETKKVLDLWKTSSQEIPRKLYLGFSSLFAATYYGGQDSWAGVGYPGPPEVIKGSAL